MVVVEVTRKAYLASLVPVIVNAILNEHQVVADIVAFVSYGDFPRSRLGEKQRGKVLASWVTRKLRTIAQFSIRETEDSNFGIPQHRMSKSSKAGSIMGHSARRSTIVPEEPVPRSPAMPAAPPLLANPAEPSPTLVNSSAATIPEVPQIAEPLAPVPAQPQPSAEPGTPLTSDGNQFSAHAPSNEATGGHRRDFSFDFGDFGQSTTAPSQSALPAETLPYRPSPGYSQNPNTGAPVIDFPQRSDSYQPSGTSDEHGDWPQEALMYQSAYDADDSRGQGARRDFL